MKNTKAVLVLLFLLTLLIGLSACKNKSNKIGKVALVIDSDLEAVKKVANEQKKDFQQPMNLKIGEIAYIRNVYEDFAYIVLLRPMEPQYEDSVGYIPLANLKFDYTQEDMKENAIYCRIIKDNTAIYEEPNGKKIGTIESQYTMVENRQNDWVLLSQKGGAESVWVNEKEIDYDFTRFAEDVKNKEYDFEKQIQ